MRKIYKFGDLPPVLGEKNHGRNKVERAGYISAKRQIESMINAGQRLEAYRKENYHFKDDEELPDEDIYSMPNDYDASDASQGEKRLKEVQKNIQKQAKKKELKPLKDLKEQELDLSETPKTDKVEA